MVKAAHTPHVAHLVAALETFDVFPNLILRFHFVLNLISPQVETLGIE